MIYLLEITLYILMFIFCIVFVYITLSIYYRDFKRQKQLKDIVSIVDEQHSSTMDILRIVRQQSDIFDSRIKELEKLNKQIKRL
jgi:hypothetical protein